MLSNRNRPMIVAGPQNDRGGRPWFAMSAKSGVGEIHIFDFIDAYGVNGRSFLKELKALGDVSAITVHINSPGGDVFEGNTIYNLLKNHKAKVTVVVDGLAASIASVIAMAGDTIIMPKNAMMMIHDPSTVAVGTAENMRKTAGILDKIRQSLVTAYATKSGLNDDEIKTLMADETWFTSAEAVAMGFADEVAEEVKIAASFDISNFKNCPPTFLAALAEAGSAVKPGSHRSPPSEHNHKESIMDRASLLALAAALGLAITANLNTVIETLITDKADFTKAMAELQKLKPAATAPSALSAADVTAATTKAVTDAMAAERVRASDIRAAAEKLKVAGLEKFDQMVIAMIADGTTADAARTKLFEARAEHEEKVGPIIAFGGNTQTFDNPEFRRDALATAFAANYSQKVKPTDQSKPFMTYRPLEMAAHLLEAQGKRIPRGTDRDKIIAMALHTTSDFPYLLADAANKLLLPEYQTMSPTYKFFCGRETFTDFKAHKFLRLGDFPTLLEVGESGEVKRGTISESKEPVTMVSYGRILGATRQMLINDDLSAFAKLAIKAGQRVAMFENDTVFSILLTGGVGPALSDGVVLFHTTHANFQTTGTAVNKISSLSAGRAAMQKQTGLDGLKLNLNAAFLLTGPDSRTGAEQITSKTAAQRPTAFNPFAGALTAISDSNITDYAWFLFADPNIAPVMIYGSLPGQEGPRVATKEGWDVEGVELKVMRDFGTGVVDYRGAYRDDGAASVDEPTS